MDLISVEGLEEVFEHIRLRYARETKGTVVYEQIQDGASEFDMIALPSVYFRKKFVPFPYPREIRLAISYWR